MEVTDDAEHAQAEDTHEEHPGAAPSGNVTREQYLSWLDSADARSDDASVQTNHSTRSSGGGSHFGDSADGDGDWHRRHHDGDDDGGGTDRFAALAVEHLSEILTYASLPDRCRLASTCRYQRALRADYLDGTVRTLSVPADHGLSGLFRPSSATAVPDRLRTSRVLQFSRLVGLRTLEIGQLGTDEFLRLISGGADGRLLIPNLAHLSLVGSNGVTDEGLLTLGRGRGDDLRRERRTELRTVDVTFCENVTYGAAVELRKLLLPTLRMVRRLPRWLDGHFETPFAGGTVSSSSSSSSAGRRGPEEIHTYWPDGTFAFGRASQSSGFVASLFRYASGDPDHLGDRLQYNDFDVPPGWPAWTRFAYRPGVSLLRIPDEEVDPRDDSGGRNEGSGEGGGGEQPESIVRSVLVAQRRRGLRPPRSFPKLEQLDVVPLGESRFFTLDGELHEDAGDGNDDGQVMVSRMRVRPLSESELVPPEDLTERNLAFIRDMAAAQQEAPALAEDILHAALSGADEGT